MPATYEPIATTTLGSAAASITFSSIPATYTDLRVVLLNTTSAGADVYMTFNNDTATNYSLTNIVAAGAAVSSDRYAALTAHNVLYTSTTVPTMGIIDIFSYAGSTNKTMMFNASSDFNGSGYVIRGVGLWRNTAAITSIKLDASDFSIGTTATLYGIKNA
jgi:hypothetical protein